MDSFLNVLVSFVFILVGNIANNFIAPFVNIIVMAFPSSSQYFDSINLFLTSAVTYVGCIYRWFLFTPAMFNMLFGYFIAKYGIWVIALGVRATIRFYRWLKP